MTVYELYIVPQTAETGVGPYLWWICEFARLMERSGILIAIAFLSSLLGTLQFAFTESVRE